MASIVSTRILRLQAVSPRVLAAPPLDVTPVAPYPGLRRYDAVNNVTQEWNGTAWVNVATYGDFYAVGGTITTAGGRTIHTFPAGGTLVCTGTLPTGGTALIVAGGSGGSVGGGAGGGVQEVAVALTGSMPVVVGAGGTAGTLTVAGANGGDSSFAGITSIGGGHGAAGGSGAAAASGGSGGGGSDAHHTAGTGTTGQGHSGGDGSSNAGGGGGGAGSAGSAGGGDGGNGGDGIASTISGTSVYYAAGGGGVSLLIGGNGGAGGLGGGGHAGFSGAGGNPGTANTGGGGGNNAAGGSGVIIISYPTSSAASIFGDVFGPAGAIDGHVALFDGDTGKFLKDGGALGSAAFTASTAYDAAGSAAAAQTAAVASATTLAAAAQAAAIAASQPVDAQLTSLAALSYSANGLKNVRVNAAETAFELADNGMNPRILLSQAGINGEMIFAGGDLIYV